MTQWFEDGRLPCSFSPQLLWEPILEKMDHLDQIVANKRNDISNEQQAKKKASQRVQSTKEEIEELRCRLSDLQEEERFHAEKEKTLQTEVEGIQQLDVATLRPFIQAAAQAEREIVSQLEDQLALNDIGSPKLSLLLNCFGADTNTIQTLQDLRSMNLLSRGEVESMISGLSKDQQIAVLYTRERVKKGKIPYGRHECAVCSCETAEEMASFLNENGLAQVNADMIRKTGASGRGALLFLSAQDLQLNETDQRVLKKSLRAHRKSKN